MKKNSTSVTVMLCLIMMFSATGLKAQSTMQLNFSSIPTLLSGILNGLSSQYKFYEVKTGIDAVVTVVSATGGATIDILDDNTLTKPEAFSPKVSVPANSTGMVRFKIEFVHTITGTPVNMDSVYATAMDIDGFASMHEMDAIEMSGSSKMSYQSTTPEISVVKTANVYTATNTAGIEYDGVDTAAKNVMFTVRDKNINTFYYSAGANNATSSAVSRQKGIYFKNFTYPSTPVTVLPVRFSSFDATVANKAVMLKWITLNEINNDHYEVERSFTSDFSTIALVLDAETVNGSYSTYRFKDNSAALEGKTIVYYRLKQVDKDGKIGYSSVLAVRLVAATATDVAMQTSPNPFTQNLNIRFTATADGTADVRIINVNGQTVVSKQSVISKGYSTLSVDGLARLAPGAYVAQLIFNGKVIDAQKIIKN